MFKTLKSRFNFQLNIAYATIRLTYNVFKTPHS